MIINSWFSLVPPMFVEKPKDATVAVGSDSQVTFSCKANGSPPPEIVWKKQGSQTVLPSTAGTLILSNVKPSYEGIYTCSAQNSEGNISSDARLTVNCK